MYFVDTIELRYILMDVAKGNHFLNFVREAFPSFKSKKRTCLPRKWSSKDHYFYKQIIHNAQDISDIPSSLAYEIAEIVRNTSVLSSDWKKVARGLGLDDESELKNIEDAARYRQELPLYIALTSVYKVNPAASLGALLESLMSMKRHDILLKIQDIVQDIVHEHNGCRPTKNSFCSQNEPKKQPVEDSITYDMAGCKEDIKPIYSSSHSGKNHCHKSHTHCDTENNYDSAFYEQQSSPNSLLEILNMSDKIIKKGHDPVRKQLQNKENIFENRTPALKKVDLLEATDFQFLDPNVCYSEVSKNAVVKTCTLTTMHTTDSTLTNTEVRDSYDVEKHHDSELTSDEDLDPDLIGQEEFLEEPFATNLCGKYAALTIDVDNRRKQEEQLSVSDYIGPQNTQSEELIYTESSSGSDSETYDINNTVNENIEGLVAERNASIRCVEKAERKPHSALLLETHEPLKKPADFLLTSMKNLMPPDIVTTADSIKVIVVHSEEDGGIATDIAAALVKEFQMAAVAECQLKPVWHLDPGMLKRTALYWADVIVPLITNKWLEDISNEELLQKRETASLNTRNVFKILQNMFMNRGSMNFSCIPVVMEGTNRRFQHFPEIRDALRLPKDINKNSSFKELGDFIKGFHNLTKDARMEAKLRLSE